ncbi:MAG: type II toxin-antitoxin system HicB family antitoxin [Campylobacteraceae bacterium]|jgi:predicted RNase H-like HicB family nuclease|nr:type II toxin-antitoxin system HicB family antitoxin [Campylobacteraceae bacterium]
MQKDLSYYMDLDYEIVIKRAKKGDKNSWFAYYKDFKNVNSEGESASEAIYAVREAFVEYVKDAIENKRHIFEPSEHEKAVRINISINAAALKKIDDYIKPIHISRSAFLQKSAIEEIERN